MTWHNFKDYYYSDDSCVIINGDCNDYLTEGFSVDITITDPPYGMNYQSQRRSVKHKKIIGDDSFPVDTVNKIIGVSRCAAYLFCRWENLNDVQKPDSFLIWEKNNMSLGDFNGRVFRRQWEGVAYYARKDQQFTGNVPSDLVKRNRTENKLHPTQKPVSVITYLLGCQKGDIVFDPYMGSGTTLRAAKDLQRKAIGIELDEEYCETAAKRLQQEVLPF